MSRFPTNEPQGVHLHVVSDHTTIVVASKYTLSIATVHRYQSLLIQAEHRGSARRQNYQIVGLSNDDRLCCRHCCRIWHEYILPRQETCRLHANGSLSAYSLRLLAFCRLSLLVPWSFLVDQLESKRFRSTQGRLSNTSLGCGNRRMRRRHWT